MARDRSQWGDGAACGASPWHTPCAAPGPRWPAFQLLLLGLLVLLSASCAHRLPERWVHDLELQGNHAISDSEIKRGLDTRKTGWWPFAARREYDPAAIAVDRRRIERLYAENGYLEATIGAAQVAVRKDGGVDIKLQIREGEPTHVHELRLQGLPLLSERLRKQLQAKIGIIAGQRLDYRRWEQAKATVTAWLRGHGYAYAITRGNIWVAKGLRQADLVLTVRPGPLVHLKGVKIIGAGAIPETPIRLQQPWSSGAVFRPDDLTLLSRRLGAMGVFSMVTVSLPEPPQPDPEVQLRLTPGKLRRIRLGGGLGLERRRQTVHLLADWTHHNFFGKLRTLRLQLKPAWVVIPTAWDVQRNGPAVSSSAELVQPFLFGTRFSASALAGYDLDVEEGYSYHGPRTRLLVERPVWRDRIRFGLSWNLQYLMFFDINPAVFNPAVTPLGLAFRGSYRLAWIEQSAILDLRDNPLDAQSGVYLETRFEEGLPEVGGDFRYLKITPDLRGYVSLGSRLTLAGRAVLGWLRPLGGQESAVTRRYFFGGPTSHRGFSYGRLAPQATDPVTNQRIPLGGAGAVLFSVEARARIFQIFGYWVALVPFFDAGDVAARFQDLDLSVLHLAVGGSLAYETPIGALRTGVGVRLNRLGEIGPGGAANPDPGQRIAFHLTLGAAF